jgi:hypothetical protein
MKKGYPIVETLQSATKVFLKESKLLLALTKTILRCFRVHFLRYLLTCWNWHVEKLVARESFPVAVEPAKRIAIVLVFIVPILSWR